MKTFRIGKHSFQINKKYIDNYLYHDDLLRGAFEIKMRKLTRNANKMAPQTFKSNDPNFCIRAIVFDGSNGMATK